MRMKKCWREGRKAMFDYYKMDQHICAKKLQGNDQEIELQEIKNVIFQEIQSLNNTLKGLLAF
jgi:hypothetical protein